MVRLAVWATYPFLLLPGIFISGTFMVTAFVVPLTIRNDTHQLIFVTPIGTTETRQLKTGLPIVLTAYVPIPAGRMGAFPLPPGESVTVKYDMDDVNFSEIVVEGPDGVWRQLVTDPNPPVGYCYPPSEDLYSIDDLSGLEPVPPAVQFAADQAIQARHGTWAFLAFVVSPWLLHWILQSFRRRLEHPVTLDVPSVASPA